MQEFEESVPEDCILFINQCILNKMKPTRQDGILLISQRILNKMKPTCDRRFISSDKTDR